MNKQKKEKDNKEELFFFTEYEIQKIKKRKRWEEKKKYKEKKYKNY